MITFVDVSILDAYNENVKTKKSNVAVTTDNHIHIAIAQFNLLWLLNLETSILLVLMNGCKRAKYSDSGSS